MENEENKASNTYTLTAAESAHLQILAQQKVNLMIQVYVINEQIDKLRKDCTDRLRDVDHAQRMLDGAISLLTASKGFNQAQLSPDFTILTATNGSNQ